MVQVMVWKLDSTYFELDMLPGATLLDLQAAVSMRLNVPSMFIKLVSNGGECSDSTASVVESTAGWYQMLVVVAPALDVLKDGGAYCDAKLDALTGFAKLGPYVANMECINTILNFDVDNICALCKFGMWKTARMAFAAVVEGLESVSIDVGIYSWIFWDGETFLRDLGTLKSLRCLEFHFHQDVYGCALWRFDSAWCYLVQLTSLRLSLDASEINFWIMAFCSYLMMLERLCSLELDFYPGVNRFLLCYLGEGLVNLVQLRSLKLCLHDARVERVDLFLHFIRQVGHLANIRCLQFDFSKNALGDEGAQLLGDSIGKLVKLKSLDLDLQDNQIGDEGAQCLVGALLKLTELTSLNMSVLNTRIGVALIQNLRNLEGRVKSRKRSLPS